MTAEELAEGLTPKQIKERIEYRKKLFTMLLTQDETDSNTASKKLALCQERLDVLQQEVTVNGEKVPLFNDTKLFASKWSQLQSRYELLAKQKDWKTYLSVTDVQDLNISGDTLKNTLTANQQKAQKYLTADQISQYNNWNDLSAAIAKAEATRKALEAEVRLTVPAEDAFLAEMDSELLADLLIVSHVDVTVGGELAASVENAAGTKCPRCWKHSTQADENGLCPRCAAVVAKLPQF